MTDEQPLGPPLPPGRRIHLPGRGVTFVREVVGPPGAPTLLLIHGWLASAGLNWFTAFDALGAEFNVVALDLRGHARGIRSRRVFRISDCADDIAALCGELGLQQVIAVGYSLGGPVAQLLWRRHPELVSGLVLAATADTFVDAQHERLIFTSMMAAAAGTSGLAGFVLRPAYARLRKAGPPAAYKRASTLRAWAASEFRRHDWTKIFEAGRALGRYNARPWIGEIDVPTGIVVTMRDGAITPDRQLLMASEIRGSTVHEVDGGHAVCSQRRFAPPLLEACQAVAAKVTSPAG